MQNLVFVTGNQNKADILAKHLGVSVAHQKLELDELQSLDLHEIAEHKARQAYTAMGKPALVEDVSLTFHAFGKLPGPFIKWFVEEMDLQDVCNLLASFSDRAATAAVCYCLFDGKTARFFEGTAQGSIAPAPRGKGGFGFDPIFMPEGYMQTRAEMTEGDYTLSSHRAAAMDKLRDFLTAGA